MRRPDPFRRFLAPAPAALWAAVVLGAARAARVAWPAVDRAAGRLIFALCFCYGGRHVVGPYVILRRRERRVARRRDRRYRVTCGYDPRATPDRCPERGATPKAAS
jgi:hypothetical protein